MLEIVRDFINPDYKTITNDTLTLFSRLTSIGIIIKKADYEKWEKRNGKNHHSIFCENELKRTPVKL